MDNIQKLSVKNYNATTSKKIPRTNQFMMFADQYCTSNKTQQLEHNETKQLPIKSLKKM